MPVTRLRRSRSNWPRWPAERENQMLEHPSPTPQEPTLRKRPMEEHLRASWRPPAISGFAQDRLGQGPESFAQGALDCSLAHPDPSGNFPNGKTINLVHNEGCFTALRQAV